MALSGGGDAGKVDRAMDTKLYAAIINEPGLDLATYARRAWLDWESAQAARDVLRHEGKIKVKRDACGAPIGWRPTK